MPHNPSDDPQLDQWTLGLTANGDIAWDEDYHTPELVDGTEAVKQDLLVALDTYRGEDPLDEEFGLDVFEAVKHTDNLRSEVTRTVEYDDYRHERVDTVRNVEIERSAPGSRDATVKIHAQLDDGTDMLFLFDLFRGLMSVRD